MGENAMVRRALVLALGVGLAAGITVAGDDEGHGAAKVLAARDMAEKSDGKETKATAVEVALGPGESAAPHRHPGPGFGYILEGEYEWGIDDQPAKVLKAGDTFYEPAMCLHRVSRNPGKTATRLLVVMLHPRDAEELVIPEKSNEAQP